VSTAVALFDPADQGFTADPYPVFARLRERGPLLWHTGLARGGGPSAGVLLALTHQACSAVLRDGRLQRLWRDVRPLDDFTAFNLLHRNSMLENEPPRHTRLRRLVSSAFARGHVARLEPTVAAVARRLTGELAAGIERDGSADLMTVLAEPLPVEVIAELLDVPGELRPMLRPWSNAIVRMYEYGAAPADDADPDPGPDPVGRAAEEAAAQFVVALRELAAHRRLRPGDDLVSDLVRAGDADGDRLSGDELVGTAALLLMAGHEATVNLIGNGVLTLLTDHAQWRRLATDPGLLPTAVDELARFDSPLQIFERTATEDLEICGHPVPAGTRVGALLGAAGRDPAVFTDPDRLDLARSPNPHLGFGAGTHYCVGAPLARLEVRAALAALTTTLPTLTLAAPPTRRPQFVIRGLRHLPLTATR
jgi:cytochrome P450